MTYIMVVVWVIIGALAAGLTTSAIGDRAYLGQVIYGGLGGCVAGSLFYRIEIGLPLYIGSLLSAVVGAILVVLIIDRLRTT
jgi:uncharacterized membrane protein YeaQ/YmgE (transglycosylase-associated protein family)